MGERIFKAEDKIVSTDKDVSDEVLTFELEELIPIHAYWFKWQSCGEGCVFSIDEIRHATDEEIEAGKRLETNTIDSFIEDGGFDKAFIDVFGLLESVKQSLQEIS